MGTTEEILSRMLDVDYFYNEDAKVSGIAKRAVAHGFDALSDAQKDVLTPFLTVECTGYTDPADHVECHNELEGRALLQALLECDDHESLQCDACRNESSYYARRWQDTLDE